MQTVIIIILLVLVLFFGSMILYLIRQNTKLQQIIDTMTATDGQPQQETAETPDEQADYTPSHTDKPEEQAGEQTVEDTVEDNEADEQLEQLFHEMDRRIDQEQLYLNPDFGRDEMCQLIGINKTTMGKLIRKYSNATNLQIYISRKRIAYATTIMQQHPNYSMEAIANECGIGNLSTFYRIFKLVYHISPAEFRQNNT